MNTAPDLLFLGIVRQPKAKKSSLELQSINFFASGRIVTFKFDFFRQVVVDAESFVAVTFGKTTFGRVTNWLCQCYITYFLSH